MPNLTYEGKQFYMDGKPIQLISGAMHYFRIPREYWYDRMLKLKECGFNTLETYTCWNLHEKREGEFDFSGMLDLSAYIETAESLGLYVIVRPGPYICAEWELGGLPSWLINYEGIEIRCYNELYLSKARNYYKALFDQIRPHLASNGGNVIMLQVENEYGSYGDDQKYMQAVAQIYRDYDMDCMYFTADGVSYSYLKGGTIPGLLAVGNFGSRPKERLARLEEYRPDQPLMCGEYWCGWFDHWFEAHHVRPADEVATEFKEFLDMGASINVYMFHGGTNFNFWNGANYGDRYSPTITSYDYNSPLSESGDRTELYYRMRDTVKAHLGSVPELTATDSEKYAYGEMKLTEKADLFANLDRISKPIHSRLPKYQEEIGQAFGYTVYRSTVEGPRSDWKLHIEQVHDRAQVFIDGEHKVTYERWNMPKESESAVDVAMGFGESRDVDILVENMGRVNFGPKLFDHKGIKGIRFQGQYHMGWDMYPLPMEDELDALVFEPLGDVDNINKPAFLRGTLTVEGAPKDTFLRLDNFTKGFVKVNGFNIGRYFTPAGPQKTLYVPAPFLKEGENEIMIFESDRANGLSVEFCDHADLG